MILSVKSCKHCNNGIRRVVLALAGMALLGGCGQPGPLYLPKPPAKPVPASTPAAAPAPAQSSPST